jgi:hypothetical protein
MVKITAIDKLPFTLFSTYHKSFPVPSVPYVKPIQAGKALSSLDLGFEGDNTGENISSQNVYWSELTVVYYIWKNYNQEKAPFWGLCHYRRYFTNHLNWLGFRKIYFLTPPEKAFEQIFTAPLFTAIQDQLNLDRVIIPTPYRFIKLKKWSVKQQYIKDHDAGSWMATEDAILRLYPEYFDNCNEFMNGLTCSWFNMMIASWEFWDEYLTWLFNILFDVQRQLENRTEPVPLRIYGNISERLLNVYLYHHKKKGQHVYHLPIASIS